MKGSMDAAVEIWHMDMPLFLQRVLLLFALSKVRHRLRESSKDLSSFAAVQLNVVFMTILRQLNSRK